MPQDDIGLDLNTPIQFLKGVGPKFGELLAKKGISTLSDLVHYFPRAYEDRRAARNIMNLKPDETVSLRASIASLKSYNLGRSRRRVHDVWVKDDSGMICCKFFRLPFRGYFERFEVGKPVRVIGRVLLYRGKLEFHHPDIQFEGEEDQGNLKDQLVPLYSESEFLSTRKIQTLITTAFAKGLNLSEFLPDWILEKYSLCSRSEAYKSVHFPPADSGLDLIEGTSPAQRRIVFDEFFWLELVLFLKRREVRKSESHVVAPSKSLVKEIVASLPFELTSGQQSAVAEIAQDLSSPKPMLRLLQGDVGAGKTVVAFLALAQVVEAGYQAALMAPTEILAHQHLKSAIRILHPVGIECALLTGQTKARDREHILSRLRRGEIHVLFGTHALIQPDVEFSGLALVIIDEQHRFGVQQREKLKQKGRSPHFLVMTATPIPRTLAMTSYGDLDVSIIANKPKGRQTIITRVTPEGKREQILSFLRDQVRSGRQVYVVLPLIEESEHLDLKNAQEEHSRLQLELPDFRLGLLHGRQEQSEKDAVMADFRNAKIDVLVSTTVIEVGVDVPNANVIWIQNAERFGLSQLHQLRGRVGRGTYKSYCILTLGYASSSEAYDRVRILENCEDGFEIAEKDLALRGPGEVLGTRQSGLPEFRMANLLRHTDILKQARSAAAELLGRDPELRDPEHARLRMEALKRSQLAPWF